MNTRLKTYLFFLCGSIFFGAQGQVTTEEVKAENEKKLKTSTDLTWEGNQDLAQNEFIDAEVKYRKAISKSDQNGVAPYNLGNAYYNRNNYNEAFGRFKEAGEKVSDKTSKHSAYHNMGNVFMQNKDYQQAVDAYKEALRNNPEDEETRYNLALAKEMLKKEQENQQNEDNKDEQQDKDQQQDQNQNQENEGDQEQNQDQQEQENKGEDQQEEQNNEGEGDEKQEEERKPEQGEDQQQQQPRPNQLSPQQIENLLEAMENEEKKVQEKIDAQKVKGPKTKNEKDW